MKWRDLLMVFLILTPNHQALAGAPVIDWTDIAFDILEVFEQVAEVMTTIDQLITLYNEIEHWRAQAQKIVNRDGFRLRDIEQFYSRNTLGHFYALEGGLGRLADLIDHGASAAQIANEIKEVFPQAHKVDRWQTGRFDMGDGYKDRLETLQKAGALGYSSVTESLASVGSARKSYEENEEVFEDTRNAWENPSHGEQEALDLIHVQLAQLVDLKVQQQVLMTALANQDAMNTNHDLVGESQRLLAAEEMLNSITRSLNGYQGVNDQVVR